MKKYKKLYIKMLTIILMLTFIVLPNFVSAWSMTTEIEGIEGTDTIKSIEENTQTVMGTAVSVVRIVGVGMAVIMLVVLGIKYVSSAPEAKAEFKKTAIPYVVGAVIIFASTQILGIIVEVAEGAFGSESAGATGAAAGAAGAAGAK